jgi:hypothetical protein
MGALGPSLECSPCIPAGGCAALALLLPSIEVSQRLSLVCSESYSKLPTIHSLLLTARDGRALKPMNLITLLVCSKRIEENE